MIKTISIVALCFAFFASAVGIAQQSINPVQPASALVQPTLTPQEAVKTGAPLKPQSVEELDEEIPTPPATSRVGNTSQETRPALESAQNRLSSQPSLSQNSSMRNLLRPSAWNGALAGGDNQFWKLTPIFGTGVIYDDNIFITNTNKVSDVIWSVSGGLALEMGDFRNLKDNYLIAQWVGTGYFFTENPDQDAFNQDASLQAQYRWNQLSAKLESSYQDLTGPDRQVGAFTTRQIIRNTLRFNYDYSTKTSFDLSLGQNTQIFKSYLNQYTYVLNAGVNYAILPKIKVGLEGIMGILNVEESALQYYQQSRVRLKYNATGKLDFKASAGIETREFDGGGTMKINPVFDIGAEYRPFDGTTLTALGYRNVYGSSESDNQNYVATGFILGVQQRFFQKFYAGVAFGYENDSYYGTTASSETNRIDNYIFARPNISYRFVEWLSTNVYYEFRNNTSTFESNSFADNRIGWELAVKF